MAKNVREQWEEFAELTLPEDCSATQLIETRRAFYAGVYSILTTLVTEISKLPDDEGVVILENLKCECEQFYKDMKAGKV